ncbi:MAG TPA: hypothetical protein VEL31_16170 [Ktedonobacteraceae bacterium]|nr:hypothetical protein [Ktedonobacteraceae bacterium]
MHSKDVREINEAVHLQAYKGTRNVRTTDGFRVIRARTVKGQLQVKLLDTKWYAVEFVIID